MLRKLLKILSWRRDSNPRPTDYKVDRQFLITTISAFALTVIILIITEFFAPIHTLESDNQQYPLLLYVFFILVAIIISYTLILHVIENRHDWRLLILTFIFAVATLWYLIYLDHNSLGYKDRVDKARRKQLQQQAETWTSRYDE